MLLQPEDEDAFRHWVRPKLENTFAADAEIFAKFLIELVARDESEATVKQDCIGQLDDFIHPYTEEFVDSMLKALKEKSYIPRPVAQSKAKLKAKFKAKPDANGAPPATQMAPISSIVGAANLEYEPHPSVAASMHPFSAPTGLAVTRAPTTSHRLHMPQDVAKPAKKRKKPEHDNSDSGGSRPLKQSTITRDTSAPGGYGPSNMSNALSSSASMPFMPTFPPLPPGVPPFLPPPGCPPFDTSNPLTLLAFASAFGLDMSNMPPPLPVVPQGNVPNWQTQEVPCPEYQATGICALGKLCVYQHTGAIPEDEIPKYDPEHPSLAILSIDVARRRKCHDSRTLNNKGGRARARFSQLGPSHDESDTTLVVEQIPEDYFNEDDVRAYFSQFGIISEVYMHAYKRLALVQFENHEMANQAYMNPNAIFENRFVKVYWAQPDFIATSAQGSFVDMNLERLRIDGDWLSSREFARNQAEAQKAFEERRRKEQKAAAKADRIKKQLKVKTAEIRAVRQKLAELAGNKTDNLSDFLELEQDLTHLQAAAADLFTARGPLTPSTHGRGYRVAHQGRVYASLPSRGFDNAIRGVPFVPGRSSVRRVDHRPKRLALATIEVGSQKDESLRQYLIVSWAELGPFHDGLLNLDENVPGCTNIEQHPDLAHTVILTFKERYLADMFIDDNGNIPNVGKLELSWVSNDTFMDAEPTAEAADADVSDDNSSVTLRELVTKPRTASDAEQQGDGGDETDLDVAEYRDQWL